ncbi:F-box protein 9 [Microdochium nivale]|nr:F-box protein 9 [Microdochium nivale]
MDSKNGEIQSELASFREQWRAEVSARTRQPADPAARTGQPPSTSTNSGPTAAPPATHVASSNKTTPGHRKTPSRTLGHLEDEDEYVHVLSFDEPVPSKNTLDSEAGDADKGKEPETALEFYEKAVDKETSGSLGDSLHLYRKAFRMDSRVDHAYKQKHFAAAWKLKPSGLPAAGATSSTPASAGPQKQQQESVNLSKSPSTVPNTAHHSLDGSPLTISELIASFASVSLEPAPPEVEGVAPPPCPIADLPGEILVHVLRDVAVTDIGDFMRLSQVCKRFAYLVATEDQIWRRVCLGREFGFGGMHYHWQQDHRWQSLPLQILAAQGGLGPLSETSSLPPFEPLADEEDVDSSVWTLEELMRRRAAWSHTTTLTLVHSLYGSSWQRMFRRRPRVRFNGCYISTVNYIRAGQASGHHITWNSPVHIVTYYRYLRLFRDGTAISLLTTDEPGVVVHHVTKENLQLHADRGHTHLPSASMIHALKGRWRLSSALDSEAADNGPEDGSIGGGGPGGEGDLFVETEGVGKKYMYRMELSVNGAGKKATGNNKLQWKGYWSYNILTDDWAQFGLKNDKAFFFSRVKSYGFGF